jgi:hypothetical protein
MISLIGFDFSTTKAEALYSFNGFAPNSFAF